MITLLLILLNLAAGFLIGVFLGKREVIKNIKEYLPEGYHMHKSSTRKSK